MKTYFSFESDVEVTVDVTVGLDEIKEELEHNGYIVIANDEKNLPAKTGLETDLQEVIDWLEQEQYACRMGAMKIMLHDIIAKLEGILR